jgi:hypothetical protein
MRNAECGMEGRPSGLKRVRQFRIPNSALRIISNDDSDERPASRMRP